MKAERRLQARTAAAEGTRLPPSVSASPTPPHPACAAQQRA